MEVAGGFGWARRQPGLWQTAGRLGYASERVAPAEMANHRLRTISVLTEVRVAFFVVIYVPIVALTPLTQRLARTRVQADGPQDSQQALPGETSMTLLNA